MRALRQKVDVEAPQLLGTPKCIKNAYPSHESASKMHTLTQKVGFETSKTRTLHQKASRSSRFLRGAKTQTLHHKAVKSIDP